MDTDVRELMTELREDHRNMTVVLDLLDDLVVQMDAGKDPDFELFDEIMRYMTVYPDAVHHPKEDRLYAELKAVRPDLSTGFERITMDHRHIAELSLKLRDDIASINAGSPVRRKAVVADALRYVNTLRGHMQWEELDLFRRVDEMIRMGHDVIKSENLVHTADPVFGPEVEENFGRLVECVREEAAVA